VGARFQEAPVRRVCERLSFTFFLGNRIRSEHLLFLCIGSLRFLIGGHPLFQPTPCVPEGVGKAFPSPTLRVSVFLTFSDLTCDVRDSSTGTCGTRLLARVLCTCPLC
jgi:hypothetical protein